MRRAVLVTLGVGLAAALCVLLWAAVSVFQTPPAGRAATRSSAPPAPVTAPVGSCAPAPAYEAAAEANAQSIASASWSVFGRPETGWAVYEPLVAHEIGSPCQADQPGFAAALSAWQAAHHLAASGVMDAPTLDVLRILWLQRRPFVRTMKGGVCPDAPSPADLAQALPQEGYGGKAVVLTPGALQAYRALVDAARAEQPAIAADPRLLTIFSGFRDPADDAARCAAPGAACGTVARARCSAHRTGTAMDLYLGAAPGMAPEDSTDANRLFQARSLAYLWLVANAARFGFAPYPFEPWHWEWTGGGRMYRP